MESTKRKDLERQIAVLQGRRESRFRRVQRLFDLLGQLEDQKVRKQFLSLYGKLDETMREFAEIVDRLNDLHLQLDETYSVDYQILESVEDMYCFIRQAAQECRSEPDTKAAEESVPLAQLPKIELPVFSGDPLKWPLFYDTFCSLIHNNPRLDNIAKVYYLIGSLKGRALEVCAGLSPTASNYTIIWNNLVKRFQNPRLLAETYFQRLLEFRPISQESAENLHVLAETFWSSVRALQQLALPDLADFIMASLALAKLDPATRKAFEMTEHSDIPTFEEVIRFVQRQAAALSQLRGSNSGRKVASSSGPSPAPAYSRALAKPPQVFLAKEDEPSKPPAATDSRPCPICRGPHIIYSCDLFSKASRDARWKLVEKHQLCFNCLSDVHKLSACNSQSSCRICQKRHHSMLHRSAPLGKPKSEQAAPETPPTQVEMQSLVALQPPPKFRRPVVVLPTAVVRVVAPKGEFLVRFLVDSGSQAHLVSLKCVRKLGLDVLTGPKSLGGIGGTSERVRGTANFIVQSRLHPAVQLEVDALVLQRITTPLPSVHLEASAAEKFAELPLADPAFSRPGEIEGVLGAAVFAQIVNASPPIKLSDGPTAIATDLGYLIMGSTSVPAPLEGVRTLCTFDEPSLDSLLRRFWELENVELPVDSPVVMDECEKRFRSTTTRNREGRYAVELPFTEFPPHLGESYTVARNRLLSLERHLRRTPDILEKYRAGMRDYLDQGHVSPVFSADIREGFFIPHFAVFKSSSSTPVRIVFDASCKTTNGRSLNDVLLTGPKLQSDLQDILLRFRVHPVAIVADIRQMYRNIEVAPSHRKFQRFLWRFQLEDPIQVFQLNCVPFGLCCAPFLALRTVQQLAEDERSKFPIASRIATHDMYVDDVVTSLAEEEVADAIPQLLGLFRAGGFTLSKWSTNSPEGAKLIPTEDLNAGHTPLDKGEALETGVKVLGLNWDANLDVFFFVYSPKESTGTKRQILSTLARIWDPLGFLAPITLLCKTLVKRLWLAKCGWDDPPPDPILRTWTTVVSELGHLTGFSIPRYPGVSQDPSTMLVGFSDSSEIGFGAVIYLICRKGNEELDSSLLVAKSKVAPAKLCTIPRLELCAALLLARLIQRVRSSFPQLTPSQIFALSDSEDVLYWLSKPSTTWKTFVANRVAQIQEIVSADRWFHVPGVENIADLISRGSTPLQLLNHPAWRRGPSWLLDPVQQWPIRKISTLSRDPLESKPFVAVVTRPEISDPVSELIERSSSWSKLRRVVVYLLRFGKRLPRRSFISATDLELAEIRLIRIVQMEHFAQDFALLAQKKPVSPALLPLNPFLHEGCLRVGGRLEHAPLTFEKKHPLLLPKGGHLVELIVDHFHKFYLHAGPNLLLSLLRQKFWILGARNLIRKRTHACNRCFRLQPKGAPPLMGALPQPRVSGVKPFLTTGVDFAGPFRVTIGRYRGVRTQKAYVCLFICLATKALHLELATDLSTDAFLNCLLRFISRRGPVAVVYSDCGTNFVGAKTRLEAHHEMTRSSRFRSEVGNFLASRKIEWKFNPPSAPHFGGIWEANVKSVKTHLFRTIGTQTLSWEEFSTLLVQIESLLNSRPLCVLSSDPGEVEALTPAHFLTLTPLRELPLFEPVDLDVPLRVRKNLVSQMVSTFWKRWRLEYLSGLQPRKRWTRSGDSLAVGTVVVIRDDNSPPLRWPLGVIEDIHPGADGVVRVVTVRVRGALLKRPVVKLYPLPNQ